MGRDGCRYYFEAGPRMASLLAQQEGLKPSHAAPFAGSSDPLHRAVLAFTSKGRPLITADPGYESPLGAAEFTGGGAIQVPLTSSWAHDVRAMLKAHPTPGLFYICNPNNPTGTITPRADIEWLLANKPAGSIVLLDEAYIHLCNEPRGSDLVAAGKDVIILRTFSKIYGMAGIRAGAALARPDLLARMREYGVGFLPTTGMAAAEASLKVPNLVSERRKIIAGIRDDLSSWLTARKVAFIPSVSNKIMIDVKRPGREAFSAMAAKGVYVGRSWPSLPTHIRVSIGTKEEMERFKQVFAEVMA
jgi:histidinol-phosphate/aromatic aminotransferase/cobyric acid decarboxylase-like protein